MKKTWFFFLFAISTISIPLQAQQPSFISDSLDNYIQQGIKDWSIPGLAITIVKDGKVVLSKGYGVSNINTQQKVDGNTLFGIASNSKAFTSAALGMLVD